MSKPKKGNWIVRMRCTVTKDVYCSDCTEDEARDKPFEFSLHEVEIDMPDWEVRSVKPND